MTGLGQKALAGTAMKAVSTEQGFKNGAPFKRERWRDYTT
jgi:hypothetical protein